MFKMYDPISYSCPRTLCCHELLEAPELCVFMTESACHLVTRLETRGPWDHMSMVDQGARGDWWWGEGLRRLP